MKDNGLVILSVVGSRRADWRNRLHNCEQAHGARFRTVEELEEETPAAERTAD